MFDKNLDAMFDRSLDRHLEPFGVEDSPLVEELYSITRGERGQKSRPLTRAETLAAAKRLTRTPIPPNARLNLPQHPVSRPEMAPVRRARGG